MTQHFITWSDDVIVSQISCYLCGSTYLRAHVKRLVSRGQVCVKKKKKKQIDDIFWRLSSDRACFLRPPLYVVKSNQTSTAPQLAVNGLCACEQSTLSASITRPTLADQAFMARGVARMIGASGLRC